MRASGRPFLVLAALAVASACGKSTSGPSEPTQLVFTAGQNQIGQVGSALPLKVVVEARNTKGTLAGVTIAVGVQQPGGGSVSPQSAVTAADGTAQFTWTLGPVVGVQTLTASSTGQTPVTTSTTATAGPGAASVVVANTEAFQFVVVGHAVPVLPSVKVTDAFGNPISGASVTFEALQGGNVLTGATKTSDASGNAVLGGWTIGPDAQTYSVRARIAVGAVSLFEARGVPANFVAAAGQGQSANAGTALPVLPAVRATRDDGSPLPNVPVTFTVIQGGGQVTGSSSLTAADGTARPTLWVLGTVAGNNRLEASTFGRPSVLFDAVGTPAVPAVAVASAGSSLAGFFGNYLAGVPEVTVKDALGNPIAGVTVTFQVTAGGGRVTTLTPLTDFLGKARASSWRLGLAGTQTVSATAGSLPPVVFTATGSAPPASTFKIEVRYEVTCTGCLTPTVAQKAAFDLAIARWTQLLLAGGDPYQVKPNEIDPTCGSVSGLIDGVVISAQLHPIDNVNGVLGRAGPCVLRDEGFLTVSGLMEFDTADLAKLETDGQLNLVILHEMAHVLGFGTLWNVNLPSSPNFDPAFGTNFFLLGSATADPTFNGAGAQAAFYGSVNPAVPFAGVAVPVEGSGGPGTRLSHWRESSFVNELMTGILNPGSNLLSAISVQQFRDLGYLVDDSPTDLYTFQSLVQGAGMASLVLREGELPGFMTIINRQGRAVGRVARNYR